MAGTPPLRPPIDATVETETIGFDYGPILGTGVSITSVVSLTCEVALGSDSDPSSRLIGDPTLIASKSTGVANAAVAQNIGTMIGGCTYLLQCVVATTDDQELSLWTHIECITPQ